MNNSISNNNLYAEYYVDCFERGVKNDYIFFYRL